jgi:hypothetical protein
VISTGVVSVGEYVELGVEPRRSASLSQGSIQRASAKHKLLEMDWWKSESIIVVVKQGNACGAKGRQIGRA